MNPRAADAIRKVSAYGLATLLTLLLFRVLSRAANGREGLADPELYAVLALAALAFVWVRAARRVRRTEGRPPDDPESGGQ